ncbi:hypothetical protein [Vibrio sp. SCSIO 43136]|uniref:TPR domain-containing protein n=1 Tax=Vibrio sp. SCSIO 43136 TaxID=2819101 RepID=UPI002074B412|nr:hypothetical protein [Vibrio sp. SCSIO 43136]USD66379.1 hypothetical protein J4N39_06095 [Vibrio sp. SCSIO 43136]
MEPLSSQFPIAAILVACTFVITLLIAVVFTARRLERPDFRLSVTIAGSVSLLALLVWLPLAPTPPTEHEQAQAAKTLDQAMEEVQQTLRDNPNDAVAWFELGQGYLEQSDFSAASTCFDYAIRLSEQPNAAHYSAKATADYYLSNQNIKPAIQRLLDTALSINSTDRTALTLMANDHFISFRYQEAIQLWERLLDSKQKNLDRAAIIHSINQARALVKGSGS